MRFPLTSDMAFVNQNGKDDINKLVNKSYGQGKYTIYNPLILPYTIVFDLDLAGFTNAIVKELHYIFNTGNAAQQHYYIITKDTGQKVEIYSLTQGQYQGTTPVETVITIPTSLQRVASRFIFETNLAWGDFPDWFELWGDFTQQTITLPAIQRSPIGQSLGVCTKYWDIAFQIFPEKEAPIKGMVTRQRLYSDHNLTFDANGNISMNGFWKGLDNIKKLRAEGIDTQLCYLDIPEYPFPTGDARTNTDTYINLGKRVYQLVSYLAQNGKPVKWFELGNEWNKWYGSNPSVEFTDGYGLATVMSVCYDGHKGKYSNCGAKQADNAILFSICGLASSEPDILYQVTDWTIQNRGLKTDGTPDYPFDIYSYHSYSSLGGQYAGLPGGVPPEIGMVPQMKRINTLRKQKSANTKVHIGEWGWDIHPDSPLNAPAFGSYSAWQTCSIWTVRALLAMTENEIDASSYFRIVQDWPNSINDNNGGIFATMALNRQEADGVQTNGVYTGMGMHRTMAGDYMKQLAEFFAAGFLFDLRLSSSPNVLKFKKGTTDLYVIWEVENMTVASRPQFTEKTGTYSLNVKGKIRRFVDNLSGLMSSEDFAGGTIAYGSKPVLVIVDNSVAPPPPPPPPPPVTKEIYHKGYWTINSKRVYYVNYKDGSWVLANASYQPL